MNILVFHGSKNPIESFDKSKHLSGYYPGFYTTTDKNMAMRFGKTVYKMYINSDSFYPLENEQDSQELKTQAIKNNYPSTMGSGYQDVLYLQSQGYEGIKRGVEYIVFNPEKSVQMFGKLEEGNMNFKEWFLTEIFNTSFPIRWIRKNHSFWEGEFFIPDQISRLKNKGKKYIISMIKDIHMGWEVKFELVLNNMKTQDITGTGNALQVFSTVIQGIAEWLKKEKPDSFALSAREDNRQSLYKTMMQRMLPDWKIEDLGTTFFLQNKKSKKLAFTGFSSSDFDDYNDDDY